MNHFRWSNEKNLTLQLDSGISFEAVVFHIERGDLLDILEHQNPERYPGQKIFAININDYVYLVPFVEDEATVFLKTVYPSRKATRTYLGPWSENG